MTFCGKDKKYTDTPQWFDPLGPNAAGQHTGTGGPEAREALFNSINDRSDDWLNAGKQAGAGLRRASADPAWAAMQREAGKVGAGGYLAGTPAFDQIFSNYRNAAGQKSGVTQNTLNGSYLGDNPTGSDWDSNRGGSVTQNTLAGKYLDSARS
jgi:hypothetical protein